MPSIRGLSIVIPCLNEQDTIVRAVNQALSGLKRTGVKKYEVIVADNGSTDKTLTRLKKFASTPQVRIIPVPIGGYGAALHFGITRAKYAYVLFADADLSYDFKQAKRFLPHITSTKMLVLGSRFKGTIKPGAMPFLHRFFGTPILTALIRWLYQIPTTDCNSGMRLVGKQFYRSLNMKNSGMEWASELLIKTALAGGQYAEVPITLRPDQRPRRPHLNSWVDGWRHLKVIVLLKPVLLLLTTLVFLVAGLWLLLLRQFDLGLSMILFAQLWLYSFLALKKLQAAITDSTNSVVDWLDRQPLVIIGLVGSGLGLISLPLLLQTNHPIVLYIVVFQCVVYDLWLFFIETINTHLVKKLD